MFFKIKAKRDEKFIKKYGYLLIIGNNNGFIRVGVLFPGTPFIDIQESEDIKKETKK